jgi:hypothetical protein
MIGDRKPIFIASPLLSAIAVLGIVQWASGFRGDLLWVIMTGPGILLLGTILGFLQNATPTSDDNEQFIKKNRFIDRDWLEELHWNDPYYLGSPSYRGHLLHRHKY